MHDDIKLMEIITNLISQKREGDYWDFKQEHHKESKLFVHDVMCLANNKDNVDAYLIYGVTDTAEVIGVPATNLNQDSMIQMIEGAPFAGGNYPYVTLHSLSIDGKKVDVLAIKKSNHVPFYLYRDNKKDGSVISRAGVIYARNGSKNTNKTSTPSVAHIENLWKIRFGISQTPAHRFMYYLMDYNNWVVNMEGNHYYKHHPEFTITFTNSNKIATNHPDYADGLIYNDTVYQNCIFRYYGTEIYRSEIALFNEGHGQYSKPSPERGSIYVSARDMITYRYYIKDTLLYALYFYTKHSRNIYDYNNNPHTYYCDETDAQILFFDDIAQYINFNDHMANTLKPGPLFDKLYGNPIEKQKYMRHEYNVFRNLTL